LKQLNSEDGRAGESRPFACTPVYLPNVSDRLLETVPCNICGSIEAYILQAAQYDIHSLQEQDITRTFSSSSDGRLNHQLVACARCGLQYVSPRLRADAVLEGYAGGSDEQFVSQARGREITFAKSLDAIEKVWNRTPGRLLDIGTGGGSFPFIASRRGWKADGCEPNRWLCEWAMANYGLPIRPGTVFEQQYASASYDVVTLWDVLEHTPDPKTEIREAHRLLSDNGLLVINYPDIGSWIAKVMGRSWVFLLDVHLYYFTRGTIRKLLEDASFEIVHIRPHFQRLALGYVLRRATPYAGAPARLAERVVRSLGMAEWQVPYWMGQTLVIARKRTTVN
jgi:2-polyprenyl-3-methyl-5-hydroxy-6-metoxy-1,4-benzoquinol methylase